MHNMPFLWRVKEHFKNSKFAVYGGEMKRAHPENKYFYRLLLYQ
jgi:hypothetical protein